MKKFDSVTVGIIIISLIIVIGIIVGAVGSTNKIPESEQYQTSDQEKPMLELLEKTFDFGNVKAPETKTKTIALKNTGGKDLDIRNFSTSCGCTTVSIEIDEEKSPTFSMHNNTSWYGIVKSGQTANLEIIYDPNVHPAEGQISRAVYFTSNDPDNSSIEIDFTVFVEN